MRLLSSYCWGLLALCLLVWPTNAEAFCIVNQSKAKIHVIALDASGYQTDIAPKQKSCCEPKTCRGNKKNKQTSVLVVTRYVPVAKANRPGWLAECKGKLEADGILVVKGNHKKIICDVK